MKSYPMLLMAIALLSISAGSMFAVPSAMTHEMSGVVKGRDQKTITILTDGASKSTVFNWNSKETQFMRDGRTTTVDALEIGTTVRIRCSHPIVGSASLLYRVSWQTKSPGKGKSHSS